MERAFMVLDEPLKKIRFLNFLIGVLILVTALFTARSFLAFSFAAKGSLMNTSVVEEEPLHPMLPPESIMKYAPIVEKNPFGPSMEFRALEGGTAKTAVPGSPSELLLFGTAMGPENLSYAVFADKSKPAPLRQELFARGDEVYNYGTLTKITNQYVELSQGAKTFTIPVVETEDLHGPDHRTLSASPSNTQFARRINEKQYLLDQRKVQQAFNKPEQILSDARLYPNMVNGNHEGFRVLEVKRGGLYEELGLKNRDILLRINGLDLTSPQAAMQAMSALKGMNTVNLDIIRGGENMTLNYQVR